MLHAIGSPSGAYEHVPLVHVATLASAAGQSSAFVHVCPPATVMLHAPIEPPVPDELLELVDDAVVDDALLDDALAPPAPDVLDDALAAPPPEPLLDDAAAPVPELAAALVVDAAVVKMPLVPSGCAVPPPPLVCAQATANNVRLLGAQDWDRIIATGLLKMED
jgi:hypothetical protein